MKKIFILIITFTLILITGSNTFAIDTHGYNLNMPLSELNGYTLREVFENRNQGMPDLTGKTEISVGVYRLYNDNGITIDYYTVNGQYKINGTWTAATGPAIIDYSTELIGYTTSISVNIISGMLPSGTYYRPSNILAYQLGDFEGQVLSTVYSQNRDFIRIANGAVFNDFTYIVQIEKGSTATPYQVPTNGPYSDVDIGQFNLTLQQIEYYFDIYNQLKIPYYNTFFDNIIITINDVKNQTQSTIQQTFDYLYDGENLTHTGQIITIFFSTALIASILILFFRSWRF